MRCGKMCRIELMHPINTCVARWPRLIGIARVDRVAICVYLLCVCVCVVLWMTTRNYKYIASARRLGSGCRIPAQTDWRVSDRSLPRYEMRCGRKLSRKKMSPEKMCVVSPEHTATMNSTTQKEEARRYSDPRWRWCELSCSLNTRWAVNWSRAVHHATTIAAHLMGIFAKRAIADTKGTLSMIDGGVVMVKCNRKHCTYTHESRLKKIKQQNTTTRCNDSRFI